jgi:protein translocase SecG subunit
MNLFIGFLTLVLVLDSLFLMLLVLVQLPKKEAGMGQAFGGGATDALFGPGSGNALTKLTKWAAGIFLVLCLFISVLNSHRNSSTRTNIQRQMQQTAPAPTPPAGTPSATPTAPSVTAPVTPPAPLNTNAVVAPPMSTNNVAAPAAPKAAPAGTNKLEK